MIYGEPDRDRMLGVCTPCYLHQQQLRFPFPVYCPHKERLLLVHGRRKFESWTVSPADVLELHRQSGRP